MNKFIDIGGNFEDKSNEIFTGENFERFISDLPPMEEEEVLRIKNSTINILRKCIPSKFEEPSFEKNTGLVLGYIQSGKTMSFTSLIALASDNDYKIVVVFAGTTTILLKQTIDRLREDLNDKNEYVIIPEGGIDKVNKVVGIVKNKVRERTIILPILKQWQHIEKLSELFASKRLSPLLPKLGVLIIDDEADQASLNGFARRNYKLSKERKYENISDDDEKATFKFSTTYNRISILKHLIPNHSYIQYTATPQANLLLDQRDLLRPAWCEVLDPGNKYTGGISFFTGNKDLIHEIEKEIFKNQEDPEMPNKLGHAFRLYLMESALLCYNFKNKKRKRKVLKLTSMMIHADRLISVNNLYLRWLKNYLKYIYQDLRNREEECIEEFLEIYDELKVKLANYFEDFPIFDEVISKIMYYVLEELEFWFVAGKNDNEVDWDRSSHHILVGGQKLDRGFTVKNLIVTYMPRTTKSKSNADTIEQRCRFFGYKKDYIEACKVYLPLDSINEFEEYVDFEKHLRDFLKKYSIDEFYDNDRLMKLGVLNPTSRNKIPGELFRNDFSTLSYFQPDFKNRKLNDRLIDELLHSSDELGVLKPSTDMKNSKDNKHKLFQTSIRDVIELLNKIEFDNKRENVTKAQFLSALERINLDRKVWLIQIAYERNKEGGRPRSLKNDGRIKSLASNYPPTFGDRNLLVKADDFHNFKGKYSNELIVQIHKIRIKENQLHPEYLKKYEGVSLNIFAMILPSQKSNSSFISIDYD